jgi:putative tryptophan/tyrosine transport system substrate-binding protein
VTAKILISLLATLVLTTVSPAEAQQPAKIWRVGLLGGSSASANAVRVQAFSQGLRDLGYVEGKNISIEQRWAEGKNERLPEFAAELVRLQVAIIITSGTAAAKTAKQATVEIPIVVASAGDLVREGIVDSLARSGGNITGLTAISPDLSGKRLEILKESVPKATRFAVIWHRNPNDEKEVKETEIAAQAMRVQLQSLPVQSPDEFQNAYAVMRKEHAGALIFIGGPFLSVHRKQLFELAATNRLPSICNDPSWAEDGCLMSYGPDRRDMFRRAATYVDKILKGAKPADLPVQQPTKFELVINLKAAKKIGVTVPPNVLARADKVIR